LIVAATVTEVEVERKRGAGRILVEIVLRIKVDRQRV
jgi:hypothetical protein